MNTWLHNRDPKRLTVPAHGSSVVTALLLAGGRIISASDDHSIHVYSLTTGQIVHAPKEHTGGVWTLAAAKDTLVSGSTDRTVRVWDLTTGRCTHVFGGHASTVRCLAIVRPVWLDITGEDGGVRREKWPKRPLIVTGSRDSSLRVWNLPKPGEEGYRCYGADDVEEDPADEDIFKNPYHKLHLEGHEAAVRDLSAHGRTIVSCSYDTTVRVWDAITGDMKWVLSGHSQKVYSVVYDPGRHQAYSGSMDGTVRIWNVNTGECVHTLVGHTSLVGLIGFSPSYLVSAAANSTLRVWDPDTGKLRHALVGHTGAITCFHHDDTKVVSGSDGVLRMWDIRDGSVAWDLLTGITGVWQVVFNERWCVAASNRKDTAFLDIFDFGSGADGEGAVEEASLFEDDGDGEDELHKPNVVKNGLNGSAH